MPPGWWGKCNGGPGQSLLDGETSVVAVLGNPPRWWDKCNGGPGQSLLGGEKSVMAVLGNPPRWWDKCNGSPAQSLLDGEKSVMAVFGNSSWMVGQVWWRSWVVPGGGVAGRGCMGPGGFDIYFCIIFWLPWPICYFWGEGWALGSISI